MKQNCTGPESLTRREREVAELIAQALPQKEAARRLGITTGTVKDFLFGIFPKLGVTSSAELIRYWMERVEGRGDCSACAFRAAATQPRSGLISID